MKTAVMICAGIVLMIALAVIARKTNMVESNDLASGSKKEKKDDKKKSKQKKQKDANESKEATSDISILNTWKLPKELTELSALCYVDQHRFATVQDELGTIFIYNTSENKIEKEIPFSGKGDYEGLTIVGHDAFVLRSDGVIFEVKDYNSANKKTIQHTTHLTEKNDSEGFCYDKKNNRLLVAIKGPEAGGKSFKGIYAFNLANRTMAKEPVYKIDLNHAVFEPYKGKDLSSNMQPSAISVHPQSGDIYITEATKPKLLVMDKAGNIRTLKKLSSSDFNQPEGIAITPEGKIFISNEGNKQAGNILEIGAI